jgi:glycerol-3-phosphate dehydrogenase (NAD(P)+)
VVVGAGSFGTATAVLLARGGFRTTLQTRTADQCRRLDADRENAAYLPDVELPRDLRIETMAAGLSRADYVLLGVPSRGLDEVILGLQRAGLTRRTPVISLAKGLVAPDGTAPTVLLSTALGASRVACIGGPAHAREMVTDGAGLVAASTDERLAMTIANVFLRAGVIPDKIGQAVEALDMVPLLAGALARAGIDAPVTTALNRLIAGELPLEEWVAQVRATVPPPGRFGSRGAWDRALTRMRSWSTRRRRTAEEPT